MECKVTIRAPVKPTENPDKVSEAITNVFPGIEPEIQEEMITGQEGLEDLMELREALEKRRIRSTARTVLLNNMRGNSTMMYINKQAALIGRVNVLEEPVSALGDIMVKVRCDDITGFIDWLTPRIAD